MFNLFKKHVSQNHFVGIGITQEGMGLAHLSELNGAKIIEQVDFAYTHELQQIDTVLANWVKQYELKNLSTNVVLAPGDTNIMLTEAPEVEEHELQQAMRWKLKDNPEFDLKNSVIDCFKIPGQRQRGRQPMAYVVSAATKTIKDYIKLFDKHNLNVKSIDITALAQRNIAHLLPEDKYGVAVLQLGPEAGLLSLSRAGDLYLARDIEVGYEHILQKDVPTQTEEGVISPAIQNSLEQIILEVQRSLDYYERYFAQAPIQNLVIAPLSVSIPALIEYMASQLGMKVRELDINQYCEAADINLEQGLQSKYLPAIGAALRFFATDA